MSKVNNKEQVRIGPASVPQEQFLESNSTITLYSGSAGAGKQYVRIL